MEHTGQEGINTKKTKTKTKKQQSGGIFEDLMKTISKQKKKNREILSNNPFRQMCGHGC